MADQVTHKGFRGMFFLDCGGTTPLFFGRHDARPFGIYLAPTSRAAVQGRTYIILENGEFTLVRPEHMP